MTWAASAPPTRSCWAIIGNFAHGSTARSIQQPRLAVSAVARCATSTSPICRPRITSASARALPHAERASSLRRSTNYVGDRLGRSSRPFAGARHSWPPQACRPGGSRAVQPRQRQDAWDTRNLGRSRAAPRGALHVHAGSDPTQSSAASLLLIGKYFVLTGITFARSLRADKHLEVN